ncbi:MAG TPA: metallophosphoesterase [Terriglobales bacterium]|nr:metallophosphoesterase [Terriglobales bacterium]
MRILAIADIHGVPIVYEWLVGLTGAVDAVILAGDLFAGDDAPRQQIQALEIVEKLRESSAPVLYIMGNDDNVALGVEDEVIKPIQGQRVEIREYSFVGYQYTPPFVGDTFVKPEEEIAADLRLLAPLVDQRTVLVTHAPAFGSLDMVRGEKVGSRAIADFLLQHPVLAHVHGHVHERFGRDGNHFNVAAAGRCRAVLIDLPSLQHEVVVQPL